MSAMLARESHLPPTPPSEPDMNATIKSAPVPIATQHKHIWVITGPAGCGKTSVAESLHSIYANFPYLEGDAFHPPENVEKMANGHPLTDADRWDWLVLLREQAVSTLGNDPSTQGVIVTCSALKRKYRDVMRVAAYNDPTIRVHFIYLNASEALLLDRVRARQNHYMKDDMVHSQFLSLETPQTDEADVLSVDASGTSVEVQALAAQVVKEVLQKDSL